MRPRHALSLAAVNALVAVTLVPVALAVPPDASGRLALVLLALATALALATGHLVQAVRAARAGTAERSPHGDAEEASLRRREQALEARAHRLEVREQRLARRLRVHQFIEQEHFVDVVDSELSAEAVTRLVQTDAELLALVERRTRHAFDDILANRYAGAEGVDMALVWRDLGEFIESVARLYQPEARDPLLETEIELVAKATSSAALHLLVVVDDLPLDLKSYNAAAMYRLLRRAADYYGTYRDLRPYLDAGLSALQAARFALGANPVTLGATWMAGKLAAHGAQKVTGQLLHRQAMQLLQDTIRVIAYEVAMVYGPGFRRRDANWFLGAELVNLEVRRGRDRRGRDEALATLCSLALRHEFDRLLLMRHLGRREPVDVGPASVEALLTPAERDRIVAALLEHCERTGLNLADADWHGWREALQARLQVATQTPPPARPRSGGGLRPPSPEAVLAGLDRWRRRLLRRNDRPPRH